MLKVTCDQSANLKVLRQLEQEGLVELYAVGIEQMKLTKKIPPERKEGPILVIGSPFGLIGEAVIAGNNTPYGELEKILGKQNHADILHLESHIQSGRDVFVTEDRDFLDHRETLLERFGVKMATPEELRAELM